jgi:hypothetical protein
VSPTSNARTGGRGVSALAPDRVLPTNGAGGARQGVAARERAGVGHQSTAVDGRSTVSVLSHWLASQAIEAERLSIRAELAKAGLL